MSHKETERALFDIANKQGGYFTSSRALSAGYSYPKQHYHASVGNWLKVQRGVYRLRNYPAQPRESLIILSLLSHDRSGAPQAVVSHETALNIHELSDANPAKVHLTVPPGYRKVMPPETVLHYGVVPDTEWEDRGGYRVTTPLRTILDIAASPVSWPYLEGAVRDALGFGLVRRRTLENVQLSDPVHMARLQVALEAGYESVAAIPE